MLTLANTMEDDLCTQIMQAAKKGYMQYSISDLVFAPEFAGLSNSVIKEVLYVMESLVRKARGNTYSQNIKIAEYPALLNNLLVENIQFEARIHRNQVKIPAFAFLDTLLRFEKANFLVLPIIELGQRVNIYIRWGGEGFTPNSISVDTKSFANIKIAELMTEVNGLRNIEQLQANYELLLKENKSLRQTTEYLLSLKKEQSNEGKSGEIPKPGLP